MPEGTWHEPGGPKGRAGLKKLLQKPVKAKDAIDAIDTYIGDDELFDDIGELEKENPNKDDSQVNRCSVAKVYCDQNGIKDPQTHIEIILNKEKQW